MQITTSTSLLPSLAAACAAPQPDSLAQDASQSAQLGRIIVLPTSTTLQVGDTVQLRAYGVSPAGDTTMLSGVEWQSANGALATVTARGTVTGRSPGLAGISARTPGAVGVSRVVVTAPSRARSATVSTTPAPARHDSVQRSERSGEAVSSSTTRASRASAQAASHDDMPHEPPGYHVITDRHFRTKAANRDDTGPGGSDGWTGGEFRYRLFSIVEDPTAPSGDGLVGQQRYPPNFRAGTGPASVRKEFPPNLTEAYVSVWAKLSPNWVGNQASVNKIFFMGVAGGNNQFVFIAYGSGNNPLRPVLALQGVLDNEKRSGHHHANLNRNVRVERGRWQRFEFVLRCNSAPGAADGTMDLWVDGEHTTRVREVNFTQKKHPERPCNMNMMNWNPTYGGGGASPGVDQWLRFDRMYISGR